MGHCYRHGDHRGNNCPECRTEEQDQQHQEVVGAIESLSENEVDYDALFDKVNNPGDYFCPWCQFRTLRYRALRCPKCQAQFSNEDFNEYWDVADQEAEEEKRQKQREEEQRAEAARKAKAEADAAAQTAGDCFVASVCFGERSAPEVVCLRKWRDRTLCRFRLGRWFIRKYYSGVGVACAKWIADKPKLKSIIRKALRFFIHGRRSATDIAATANRRSRTENGSRESYRAELRRYP